MAATVAVIQELPAFWAREIVIGTLTAPPIWCVGPTIMRGPRSTDRMTAALCRAPLCRYVNQFLKTCCTCLLALAVREKKLFLLILQELTNAEKSGVTCI